MKSFKKRAEELIRDFAAQEFPRRLEVVLPEKCVPQYNYKCHLNSAQAVLTGVAVGVIETVIIYSDMAVAHYVNLMADGSIVDFTLGIAIVDCDVRFVRYIHPDEFSDEKMNDNLWKLKGHLMECLPWYYKKMFNETRRVC